MVDRPRIPDRACLTGVGHRRRMAVKLLHRVREVIRARNYGVLRSRHSRSSMVPGFRHRTCMAAKRNNAVYCLGLLGGARSKPVNPGIRAVSFISSLFVWRHLRQPVGRQRELPVSGTRQ